MQTKTYRTTGEVASAYNVKPQTVHAGYCRNGHYFGLVPTKLPNRFLAWPLPVDVKEVAK